MSALDEIELGILRRIGQFLQDNWAIVEGDNSLSDDAKTHVAGSLTAWRAIQAAQRTEPKVIMWAGRRMKEGKCSGDKQCLACDRLGSHLEPMG